MCGCRCLGHALGTPAARIFWAHGHDDPQLCRHDIQPLGPVLADPVHLATAAGTEQAVRLDHPLDAGQAYRKMSAIAACGSRRRRAGANLCILPALGRGHGGFQVLESQLALVVVQLLSPFRMIATSCSG